MGDRHDRARELRDDRLQPGAPLGVEVRLRLVEQQQVGLSDQAGCQGKELSLPARERCRREREVGVIGAGGEHRPCLTGGAGATRLHPAVEQRCWRMGDAVHASEIRHDLGSASSASTPRISASSAATSGRAARTVCSACARRRRHAVRGRRHGVPAANDLACGGGSLPCRMRSKVSTCPRRWVDDPDAGVSGNLEVEPLRGAATSHRTSRRSRVSRRSRPRDRTGRLPAPWARPIRRAGSACVVHQVAKPRRCPSPRRPTLSGSLVATAIRLSSIENHAVSRLRPFTIMCDRNAPRT